MGNRLGSDGRFGYTNGVDPGEWSLNLEKEQLFSLVNQIKPFQFWHILNDSCKEVLLWKSHELRATIDCCRPDFSNEGDRSVGVSLFWWLFWCLGAVLLTSE